MDNYDKKWNIFKESGKIEDYLEYKKQKKYSKSNESQ
jgi:hypothetical protein